MDKLTKVFRDGEVLYAQDLNTVSEKVNEIVDEINEGGGALPAGSVTTDKIADEAVTMDKLSQDVQEAIGSGGGGMTVETFSGVLLLAETDKYYRVTEAVNTLTVQLPAISGNQVKSIILGVTMGNAPAVTFTAADGKDIRYVDGFLLKALGIYEINILYNGLNWSVAYVNFAAD